MVKVHTTLSVENDILQKAKQLGINISNELERSLKGSMMTDKSDLPLECITIKCSICGKEIEEGFLCRQRKLILCNDCQKDFKMSDCPHDYEGMHEHIKWPGFHNLNDEVIPEIEQMQKEKNKENGL